MALIASNSIHISPWNQNAKLVLGCLIWGLHELFEARFRGPTHYTHTIFCSFKIRLFILCISCWMSFDTLYLSWNFSFMWTVNCFGIKMFIVLYYFFNVCRTSSNANTFIYISNCLVSLFFLINLARDL